MYMVSLVEARPNPHPPGKAVVRGMVEVMGVGMKLQMSLLQSGVPGELAMNPH